MHRTSGDPAPLRVAFYARIGSGRADDQESAIRLQNARIQEFARRHNLQIIAEYTDLGVARSIPWPTRPAARALTWAAFAETADVDAVAIGDDRSTLRPGQHRRSPGRAADPGLPPCGRRDDGRHRRLREYAFRLGPL